MADLPNDYVKTVEALKERIRGAQLRAALRANDELLRLYWDVGRVLVERRHRADWGARAIEQLGADIQAAFPGVAGFSRTNLYRMRLFHESYPGADVRADGALPRASPSAEDPRQVGDLAIVPQAVGQLAGPNYPSSEIANLPWGHHGILIEKVKDRDTRQWYARSALEHGWSRAVLALQIDSRLRERQGQAITNFAGTLPAPQSDLAQQTLKDPFVFDFLTLAKDARERELEDGLVEHIQKFLLELGTGFAFVGRQVHVEVGGQDFYIDLLFYHLTLRCFVVIDLKMEPFEPAFTGQLNFYLSAIDAQRRHATDNPTLGLLLCRSKNKLVVEYALRDMKKPIGVADWETRLVEALPDSLKGSLPTVEELETELGAIQGAPERAS
jgi:predicted nuclease of restriction endonuclease-like (RecB) superfamily